MTVTTTIKLITITFAPKVPIHKEHLFYKYKEFHRMILYTTYNKYCVSYIMLLKCVCVCVLGHFFQFVFVLVCVIDILSCCHSQTESLRVVGVVEGVDGGCIESLRVVGGYRGRCGVVSSPQPASHVSTSCSSSSSSSFPRAVP